MTLQPCRANAPAHALPIPEEAPVTITTFPFNEFISIRKSKRLRIKFIGFLILDLLHSPLLWRGVGGEELRVSNNYFQ